MNAIQVEDLHKAYGDHPVLTGLSLEVPTGSFVAVLGASGSGKTTLLRVLAGFEGADRGTVSLGGNVVDDGSRRAAPEHRRVGYVPQEGALFPHLSVAANVAFGLPRSRRGTAWIGELLELVGLGGLERRRPHELSGGQQQRVALARALAIDPAIVLLDEPFAALDPELRATTRAEVKAALAAVGATSVLVTHDQDEALSLADEVAILVGGRIAQSGAPQRIYRAPVDSDIARFLGDANLLPARLNGTHAETDLGVLRLTTRQPAGADERGLVLIRPEEVCLCGEGECQGLLTARVEAIEYYGHDARVTLSLEGRAAGMRLLARTSGAEAPPLASRVGLTLPAEVHALIDCPRGDAARDPILPIEYSTPASPG
ncbi:MAG: iron(III) transport system ATP-binding protein [Solirubrobacteraceae bacterium]|jgi:iron(III) transport system ATP-binding protein|nr:iron(III) transport system ATP-binding protein [Solirubrobacteraceae bacterium]